MLAIGREDTSGRQPITVSAHLARSSIPLAHQNAQGQFDVLCIDALRLNRYCVSYSDMLRITSHIAIPESEIEIRAIRAQGSGGQNVNKVSSAIHVRFNIRASSLPPLYKQTLLKLPDHRISKEGVITIKAQEHRTQERNREAAVARLLTLIQSATIPRKKRKPTAPTRRSQEQRIASKKRQGRLKAQRRAQE